MHAFVLAICPDTVTGYAVVHGSRIHESGAWALASGIRTSGPISTPQETVARLMHRRLRDEVEHVALLYELDAVVIEREAIHALHTAAERGAMLAKRSCRLIDPGAWDPSTAGLLPDHGGRTTAPARDPNAETGWAPADRAIRLGRHGSAGMGIWPLDALPDGSEWA